MPNGWLWFEWAVLFIGLPASAAAGWIRMGVIPLLLLGAIGCAMALRWRHGVKPQELFRRNAPGDEWRRIVVLYLIAVPGLVGAWWLIQPAAMFGLLRHDPKVWLVVMAAYPVISVAPQELIYRGFFFERYRPVFGKGAGMVMASAVVFGFGHVVFHNWISVILTALGGALFGHTYRRTGSLLVVSIEHALYGCAIFTIGFGQFFFDGTRLIQRFQH